VVKESELAQELSVALFDALDLVGLDAQKLGRETKVAEPFNHQFDLRLKINDHEVFVDFKAGVGPSDVGQFASYAELFGSPIMVVSRRISELAREEMHAAGVNYYDTRGPLRLRLPGVVIDTALAPLGSIDRSSSTFDGEVAKEVALALLDDPEGERGVRTIARAINRSPSAVLTTLRRFHADGLTTSAYEPVLPELFWELAAVWRTNPIALAELPRPGEGKTNDLLQLGLHDDVGWALTDSVAAKAWGFGIVLSSAYPPDFYVPSKIAMQRALQTFGRSDDVETRACTVRLAPTRLVCRWREMKLDSEWPVANHVVVALDLARDESRGRELLEQWVPPEGIVRVW
jgi:hypothetical protein